MRFVVRLLGTWLVGLALILLIIDGTRSLGANALLVTAFGDAWTWLHADSLAATRAFVQSRLFGPVIGATVEFVLSLPGWVVLAVPGILLAWLGRSRRTRVFVRHDQL